MRLAIISFDIAKQRTMPESTRSFKSRTTDAQRGNGLHCTAENSLPLPNF